MRLGSDASCLLTASAGLSFELLAARDREEEADDDDDDVQAAAAAAAVNASGCAMPGQMEGLVSCPPSRTPGVGMLDSASEYCWSFSRAADEAPEQECELSDEDTVDGARSASGDCLFGEEWVD